VHSEALRGGEKPEERKKQRERERVFINSKKKNLSRSFFLLRALFLFFTSLASLSLSLFPFSPLSTHPLPPRDTPHAPRIDLSPPRMPSQG